MYLSSEGIIASVRPSVRECLPVRLFEFYMGLMDPGGRVGRSGRRAVRAVGGTGEAGIQEIPIEVQHYH
jgi:hypothetical protein